MRYEKFKPVLLPQQVAQVLTDAILDGRLASGEQLVETKLQADFGISRTPLREAFRELEKRGLVEIVPRKGAFVRQLSRQDIDDTFPVRAALEGLAAKLTCARVTPEVIEELEESLAAMRHAADQDDAKAYLEHHVAYHEAYIGGSGNEVLIELLRTLRMHTIWHRFYFKYHKEDYEKSLAIHQRILELMSAPAPDPVEVERVVREHINSGYQRFIQYLEDQAS